MKDIIYFTLKLLYLQQDDFQHFFPYLFSTFRNSKLLKSLIT